MKADEIKLLEASFIEGYRTAQDKLGFLTLTGIPLEVSPEGKPAAKLIEVKVAETFTVGQAGPGFGSSQLVYHPLPGKMVTRATVLEFVYVHAQGTESYSLNELLAIRDGRDPNEAAHDHAHAHAHGHHHHHHDHHH